MTWRDWFAVEQPSEEKAEKFLEVTRRYGAYGGVDYYAAGEYRPHLPSTDTLVVQRNGQQSPVAHYGPGGWVMFRWVMRKPSEVALFRADRTL